MQPQSYQSLFQYEHFQTLLDQIRTIGGVSGIQIFAGRIAWKNQALVVSDATLTTQEIYDLGEDLLPISAKKSILYVRVGLLLFVVIVIYLGLHAHGIV
jgi:hypothetical protein